MPSLHKTTMNTATNTTTAFNMNEKEQKEIKTFNISPLNTK